MKQIFSLKNIIKLVVSIILFIVLIFSILYISNNEQASREGYITIIINNIDNEIVCKERVDFKKGDNLFDVLKRNYKVHYKEELYGKYLTGIEGDDFSIITSGDDTGWIWFEVGYLNEGASFKEDIDLDDYTIIDVNNGIDNLEIRENMIFAINQRDNNHLTSVLNQNINLEILVNKILKIVSLIIFSLGVIGVILYLVLNKKKREEITVRQMCILAFMAVMLFVQEELLSIIPNVQLTFLLISVYSSVFGFRKTSIIIFVHVLLDNLVMGSLNPMVMIPMFIGYNITALLIYLVRNYNLIWSTLMAAVGCLVYSICFMIINAVVLNVDVLLYMIADIPFEAILVTSTILTMLYLYEPIKKLVNKYWY